MKIVKNNCCVPLALRNGLKNLQENQKQLEFIPKIKHRYISEKNIDNITSCQSHNHSAPQQCMPLITSSNKIPSHLKMQESVGLIFKPFIISFSVIVLQQRGILQLIHLYEESECISTQFLSLTIKKEPKRGMVQVLYESFANLRKQSGDPVFVFWDFKCLNLGQNWEQGFLNALKNSRVIVLLISMKVC